LGVVTPDGVRQNAAVLGSDQSHPPSLKSTAPPQSPPYRGSISTSPPQIGDSPARGSRHLVDFPNARFLNRRSRPYTAKPRCAAAREEGPPRRPPTATRCPRRPSLNPQSPREGDEGPEEIRGPANPTQSLPAPKRKETPKARRKKKRGCFFLFVASPVFRPGRQPSPERPAQPGHHARLAALADGLPARALSSSSFSRPMRRRCARRKAGGRARTTPVLGFASPLSPPLFKIFRSGASASLRCCGPRAR